MAQIFVSHASRDRKLAPWFAQIFALEPNVGAVQFEFEFEAQQENPTANIKQMLVASSAVFVLLSPEVLNSSTLHTGNWVSAEVGMARGLNKPIWVFETLQAPVDFPVPFVDHYIRLDLQLEDQSYFTLVRSIIRGYGTYRAAEPWEDVGRLMCANSGCQTVFQIHQANLDFGRCPACCSRGRWDKAFMTCRNCEGKGVVGLLGSSACRNCRGRKGFLVNMGSSQCPLCDGNGTEQSASSANVQSVTKGPERICAGCVGTGYLEWSWAFPDELGTLS